MTPARFLIPAELELRETVEYLDEQLEQLGDRFSAEVESALRVISDHPKIGHLLTKRVRRLGLRTFP